MFGTPDKFKPDLFRNCTRRFSGTVKVLHAWFYQDNFLFWVQEVWWKPLPKKISM